MVLFWEAAGGANAARQLIGRTKFTIVNLRREDELADELRESPLQRNRLGSCEGRRLTPQENNCSLPRKKWVYIYKDCKINYSFFDCKGIGEITKERLIAGKTSKKMIYLEQNELKQTTQTITGDKV